MYQCDRGERNGELSAVSEVHAGGHMLHSVEDLLQLSRMTGNDDNVERNRAIDFGII